MIFSGFLVAICICFEFVESYCPLSDNERLHVPPLFDADSFPECKNEGNIYCRLKFTLLSENNNTESWRVTELCILIFITILPSGVAPQDSTKYVFPRKGCCALSIKQIMENLVGKTILGMNSCRPCSGAAQLIINATVNHGGIFPAGTSFNHSDFHISRSPGLTMAIISAKKIHLMNIKVLDQKSRKYKQCFSRDVVYRYRCFPKILENQDIQINAIQNENILLEKFSVKAQLDNLKCNKYHSRMDYLRTYDYIFMLVLIGYLTIIGVATVTDLRKSNKDKIKGGQGFLTNFSIIRQWNSLKEPIMDYEYNKMKSLQGVRTYTMVLVVAAHTMTSASFSYVKDEKYLENLYVETPTKIFINIGSFLVQTNFMMSGWLATKMVMNHVDKGGQVSVQFVITKIFMRYVRLFFPMAFMICFELSNWSRVMIVPPPLELLDTDYDNCQKNWWASILLLNNLFLMSEMCNSVFWYLANDFHFYILSLVMYYLMYKFRIGMKMIAWAMTVFWLITACLIYYHNYAVLYPFYAEYGPLSYCLSSYQFYVVYTSIYINFASYGVGLIFGNWNHRYKNHTFNFNKVVKGLWLLVFLGLPILAIYSALFEYSRLTSALLGPSLRLLFSLGIAVGFLGMIHGMGGIIKTICEWKFAEFVARWSYSTYVIHVLFVVGRHLLKDAVEDISHEILIKSSVVDIILSFIAGLVMHLIIERPLAIICSQFLLEKLNKKKETKKITKKKNK